MANSKILKPLLAYNETGDKQAFDDLKSLLNPDTEGGGLNKTIAKQIEEEYQLCYLFMKPKIQEWLSRLRIYNNQKRAKDKVGDQTMFVAMQTILANLYDDRLNATANPREEGDVNQAENYGMLMDFDAGIMKKEIHDYHWDFDACFYGRGYSFMNDFDRESKTPIAEVLDPSNILRDPSCVALNGDIIGRNAARFWGTPVNMTKYEMKENGNFVNLGRLKKGKEEVNNTQADAQQARWDAAGYDNLSTKEETLTENYQYRLLRWFTHIDGQKVIIWLANNRTLVVRVQKLAYKTWPISERQIFPISHEYDGVSVPDLTEDKQRMKAVLINLGVDVAKADLYPMRVYDHSKIKNRNNLNFEFNKWIPSDGPPGDAVQVLASKQISNSVEYIMTALTLAAEKSTAVTATQQGLLANKSNTTLGEIDLASQNSGTRFSLTAKIFGWSEKAFWNQHYWVYNENYKEGIDKKILRLVGAFGPKWLELGREDIIMGNPLGPDIEIESKIVSEGRKLRDYQQQQGYFMLALQDPEANRRYGLKHLGRTFLKKAEIDRLFPPTVDELEAEEENEELNKGNWVQVRPEQNHVQHKEKHAEGKDTDAMKAHIKAHNEMLRIAKIRPDLFPQLQPPMPMEPGQQTKSPATEPAKETPMSANQ